MNLRNSILLLISVIFLCSCTQNSRTRQLEAEIESSNRQCPISLGANGALVSMEYDKGSNAVVMNYRLSRYYGDPAALARSSAEQKGKMADFLRRDENRRMLNLFVDAGASLSLSFLIGDATEPVVLTLSASELRTIANQTYERDNMRTRLSEIARAENETCPRSLAEGITATAVAVESEFLAYNITVPDSVVLATSAQQAAFRQALVANLDSARSDTATASTLRLLRNMDYGIRYRIFNPADSSTFVIDIKEDWR